MALDKVKFTTLTQLSSFIFLIEIGKKLWSFEKHQKAEVYSRLDRCMTKYLLINTTFGKKFGTKSKNLVKLDSANRIRFLLLCISWLLFPKFNFWKQYLELGSIFNQTWDFANALYFLKILSDLATCGQFEYRVYHTSYKPLFYF